jgi:hypothetical protein
LQPVGVAVWQVPVPEQVGAGVKVVPVQVALPQTTVAAAWVQAPAPLQAPVLPQVPLAAQRACGSVTPLPTFAQVPRPFRLQAWQVPQAVEAQQTPSTQAPLLHSWLEPQAVPFPFCARQLPPVPVQ